MAGEKDTQLDEQLEGAAAAATPTPTPQPEEDPRMQAMRDITAANVARMEEDQRRHNEENGIAPAPAPTEAPAPTPSPTPAPAGSDLDTQMADGEVLDAAALAGKRIKVIIDGTEQIISGADAVRNYQKQATVDKRLTEANELLRAVKDLSRSPATPPVGSDDGKERGNTPASPTPKATPETQKELITALFSGDEETALAALNKVLETPHNADIPSEAELLAKLTPKVRQQLAAESALDRFAKDYSDVAADPILAQVVDANLARIVKEDPNKDFATALVEAGDSTREWMKSKGMAPTPAPTPSPQPTASRVEKLDRKAAAPNVAGLNARASGAEPVQPTVSDTIAAMRKARNLEV